MHEPAQMCKLLYVAVRGKSMYQGTFFYIRNIPTLNSVTGEHS